MRVRTAASASSREGLGTTGSGAWRTCSDRDGLSAGFGQGFTTASIAVSPFDRPWAGGVTGAAASVIRAFGDSTHARRPDAAFPYYMASPRSEARPPSPILPVGWGTSPYIFLRRGGAIGWPTARLMSNAM